MGRRFPAVKVRALLRILERHCGPPTRTKGSHHMFTSPHNGRRVLLAVHPGEMPGTHVRDLLMTQLGLSEDDAWREVSR